MAHAVSVGEQLVVQDLDGIVIVLLDGVPDLWVRQITVSAREIIFDQYVAGAHWASNERDESAHE